MLTVAVLEFVQFFLAVKEGRYPVRLGQCRFVDVLQLAHEVHEGYSLVSMLPRAAPIAT